MSGETHKAEVLSDALLLAANTLALEKVAADDRRNLRDLIKAVILALVIGLPAIIGACGAIYTSWRIDKVAHEVNSMKDELVESVRSSSHAEGVLEGKKK